MRTSPRPIAAVDVDLPRLKAEQERIFRKRHIEFTHIGVGVTPEGQAVFDVLAKTLPCEWEGNVIVVFGTVRLGPPYDIKSIRYVDLRSLATSLRRKTRYLLMC